MAEMDDQLSKEEWLKTAPGSRAAAEKGCACPVIDNHMGRGCRGDLTDYVINAKCPLHGEPRTGQE